jgi:tellurite resistance protein TerC
VFASVVTVALLVDLLVVNRTAHVQTTRQAGGWVVVWISLAIAFNVLVFVAKGHTRALEFSTAYLIELSLSVDNLFIFLVIFKFFGVKPEYQHRTLFWGIMGALIMRGILIGAGVELLAHFAFLIFVFGGILIFTGIKLFLSKDESYDPSQMWIYRLVKSRVPLTDRYDGQRFFTWENGKRLATPLFLVLMVIEATDLVFAVDSIPACLAISRDAFVVYSSNIFAILGLRSIYFLLAGAMGALRFLKPALSIVLVFIGVKMMLAEISGPPALEPAAVVSMAEASAVGTNAVPAAVATAAGEGELVQTTHPYKIPTTVSLIVVAGILGLAIIASLLFPEQKDPAAADGTPGENASPPPVGSEEPKG